MIDHYAYFTAVKYVLAYAYDLQSKRISAFPYRLVGVLVSI
jgi:hypothetical protein